MNKYERIEAAVNSESVDRVPFSLWYHFESIPREERAGEKLAQAELDFYRTYDPDFLKVMHDVPFDLPDGVKEVESVADWSRIPIINPEGGYFGKQLDALEMILDEVGEDVPVIDTVFNCFAYAEKITGGKTMQFWREDPEAFHAGMSRVADSLALWSDTIVNMGCVGIYLAIQGATADVMSAEEYEREFLQYDRRILERVEIPAMMNIVHLHGERIHWQLWEMLPFHVLSWSSNLTPPSIAEAREQYSGCIIGGVNEVEINSYTPAQVKMQIDDAMAETGGAGYIAAPGCAVPTDCPPRNLHAFKEAVMKE